MLNLDLSVESLRGVGSETARKLQRLHVLTLGDLIKHYPRRYNDFTNATLISKVVPGLVTVRGKVVTAASRRVRGRNLTITEAIISDESGTLKAIWFNQPYRLAQLEKNSEIALTGRLQFRNNDLALQSPAIEKIQDLPLGENRIIPVYPETEGLSSRQIQVAIKPLLARLSDLPETLPGTVIEKAQLISRAEALKQVHTPTSSEMLERARHRIAFEELFLVILASLSIKQEIKTEESPKVSFQLDLAKRYIEAVGFDYTNAQRQAAWQILNDMEREHPMNRLLEGDVGSGKTVVAVMAAVMAIASGYQAALMVPTELLARQHFAKITPLIQKLGYEAVLFLGNQNTASKRKSLETTAEGKAHLIIGTHALIGSSVKFHSLGLVIIDEQHRFGVAQRQELKKKAGRLPHLLSMTATPIPRSLALTVYGDLDISIIDELPPGRQPVTTKIIKPSEREKMYVHVDQEISKGRQVFVVCPLIEDSDKTGSKSVTAESANLKKTIFRHRRIEVMHGKMTAADKQEIMDCYRAGSIDILVATTVIEVGIDIPNASIMLIEGADRFGLAALHQLRGRIGRGQDAAYCYLMYDNFSPGVAERLRAMERTSDGFRLAQIDLELRGPGQVYGIKQHGDLNLQMADFGNAKLVAQVREYASQFLRDTSAMLHYPHIRDTVNALKAVTSLD